MLERDWYRCGIAALSLAFSGCLVTISYDDSSFACVEQPICPPGFECVGGRCMAEGDPPDAAPGGGADALATPDADPSSCGNGLCELGEDCASCAVDCGDCAAALVLRWTFDDLEAGIAGDASGNGNHGTLVGGAPIDATGGPALALDGVDDHVRLAQAGATVRPSAQVAVAAWFEATATDASGAEIASMGDSYGLRLRPDGAVHFFAWDGVEWHGAETGPNPLLDGAPHHLVGQFTGTALEVWIDGELALSEPFEFAILYDLGQDLFVGRHGNGSPNYQFQGVLDDLRIYTVALTADEIGALATR